MSIIHFLDRPSLYAAAIHSGDRAPLRAAATETVQSQNCLEDIFFPIPKRSVAAIIPRDTTAVNLPTFVRYTGVILDDPARAEGAPRALTLYTYRFWHPAYRNYVTLDCAAENRELAQASAMRFINRENRRLARSGKSRCQLPNHINHLRVAA